MEVVQQMQKRGMVDRVSYSTLVNGFAKKGEMEKTLKVFQEMEEKGVKPDEATYGTLIDGYVKTGNMETALKMVAEMEMN